MIDQIAFLLSEGILRRKRRLLQLRDEPSLLDSGIDGCLREIANRFLALINELPEGEDKTLAPLEQAEPAYAERLLAAR